MFRRLVQPLLFMVCSLFLGMPFAQAGSFDVYGAGARGAAMGSAQTATADGPSALSYNPGALTLSVPGLSVGAFATFNNAQILLKERPSGYDVPDLGPGSPALPEGQTRRPRRDTDSIAPLYALSLGAVANLGVENFRAAATVVLPTNDLFRLQTHYADERERHFSNQLHFELIDSRLHRVSIELGLAYLLTSWVSFGIGGTYVPGAAVGTEVFVADPTDQANVDIVADVQTTHGWGLLAGALFFLPADVQLGLSYRGAVSFGIRGANDLQIHGIDAEDDELQQQLNWVPAYSPSMASLGLARPFRKTLVSADLRYTFWSDYRDTQGVRPEFSDRLSYRLGAEYTTVEDTRLRAGLGFEPTPIPDQTGRTNYVDNDRILLSMGSAHHVHVMGVNVEASWFLQTHYLLPRETRKERLATHPVCTSGEQQLCDEVPNDTRDPRTGEPHVEAQGLQTGNPGFPGFVSGGWIGALGFELRY
ncbi:MAG: OmpP1/FadL family transporter [Bradymonadaceae bacterium]